MAHTAGPWATMIDATKEYIAVYAKVGAGTKVICPVKVGDKADARLIAAAPDLLQLVKEARDLFDNAASVLDISDWLKSADAAIAKTEGR